MVAPHWFYLHPEDQLDLSNTMFALLLHGLVGQPDFTHKS